MEFIAAWVREHLNAAPYEPSADDVRAQELAKLLRKDAGESGISDAEIDHAITAAIGAGHGLVNYLTDAMIVVADLAVPNASARRFADGDV